MQFMRTFLLIIIASAFLTGCFNLEKLDQAVLDKNKELSKQAQKQVGDKIKESKDKIEQEVKEEVQGQINDILDSKLEDIKN